MGDYNYSMPLIVIFMIQILLASCNGSESFASTNDTKAAGGTLRLLHVLYRHGDRTPIEPYPNDPYKDISYWPVSWGQLTNKGKERHYKLGNYIRVRYNDFIPHKYSSDGVFVRSTDIDRTLMSAESHLAGLFPPTDDQLWNPSLQWQPIPVHTVSKDEDLLLSLSSPCPLYDKLLNELNQSPEIQAMIAKNKDLFAYLTEKSGRNVTTFEDVEFLYDVLFIETRFNMTLPNWTHGVYPEKLKPLSDFSFAMKAYTKEMQRLRGGPLVKEMAAQMSDVAKSLSTKKLFMYSAHDVTVAAFLSALGIFDGIQPPYASMVMVELHEIRPKEFGVQIWYKNVSRDSMEPYLLTVPGCQSLCPLERFNELIRPVISENVKDECSLSQPLYPALNGFSIIVLAVSSALIFLLLMVIAAGCIMWRRERTRGYRYSSVQGE